MNVHFMVQTSMDVPCWTSPLGHIFMLNSIDGLCWIISIFTGVFVQEQFQIAGHPPSSPSTNVSSWPSNHVMGFEFGLAFLDQLDSNLSPRDFIFNHNAFRVSFATGDIQKPSEEHFDSVGADIIIIIVVVWVVECPWNPVILIFWVLNRSTCSPDLRTNWTHPSVLQQCCCYQIQNKDIILKDKEVCQFAMLFFVSN